MVKVEVEYLLVKILFDDFKILFVVVIMLLFDFVLIIGKFDDKVFRMVCFKGLYVEDIMKKLVVL